METEETRMKIVIGYDGSKAANAALKDLMNSGLPPKAQVRMIHAVPPLLPLASLAPTDNGVTWYSEAYRIAVENEKTTLANALRQTREAAALVKGIFPGWTIKSEVCVDVPAHAILNAAEAWKADLIVAGLNGWNALSKLVLGSVADRILNHAHCTVRLGKGGRQLKAHPPRLLIAYDGSAHADAAIRETASRAWPKGTQARILAVSEFQLRMGDITMALNKALGRKNGGSVWPMMERKLEAAARMLEKAGISAKPVLIIEEPRRAILSQARKFKADTIVMGTHGTTGLQRFMLGSVSASVAAHSPCTVEVVRANTKKIRK
jgi:nucleotide-binding universal stress UspA family protein